MSITFTHHNGIRTIVHIKYIQWVKILTNKNNNILDLYNHNKIVHVNQQQN